MRSTFDSLKFFNYRMWFAGALVANVGTWMQRVAQDWLVLTVLSDDSGLAVGIVTGLQFLPMLLLSPFGGLLADRLPRRKLLIGTQTALGLLAAGLGVLVLGGHAQLWHVYVFALALGVVTALDNPVRQTFVAEMVPPASLPNAVGLNSASFNAARLIGPGISGLLIAVVGPGWIFIINAVSFAATILSLTLMRRDELHELPHTSRGRGQIREGLRYVQGRSDIVTIVVVVGVVGALGLNFQLTSAVMAREIFDKGAGEYGVLGSIMAIGSLGGALLAARRKQPRVRLVLGAAFAFGVASGLMAIMPTYELYALMTIPVGFASLTMMTAANATVQMSTDPVMRGRVMSLYMMVFLGTTPIGAPVVGWVAETFNARWAVGVGAISAMVVSAAAAVWVKRHWEVEVTYRLRHRPHLRMVGPTERAHSREEAKARLGASDAQNATGLA
ncbi:MFS transporter [Georgenia satyanarayanai]|uniref:MFS transporter n=1 Tax=Georgenia satyanarayanai TaxID=860221 RepID=UPI00203ECF45|nr:MFS transporter [Georgenia satyanarayanai]MCM3662573.1 MFS transporter [Georgenia satyanarayanai]